LNSNPSEINEMLEKFGICFMFAQKFHPAMKNVANARKVVGGRTAFNILGPLTNPAMVKNQLIGVFSDEYQERIVKILQRKNAETIMTVRSDDGMDELSTTSKNKICLLKNKSIFARPGSPSLIHSPSSSTTLAVSTFPFIRMFTPSKTSVVISL